MAPDLRQSAAQKVQLRRLEDVLLIHAPTDGRFDLQGRGASAASIPLTALQSSEVDS